MAEASASSISVAISARHLSLSPYIRRSPRPCDPSRGERSAPDDCFSVHHLLVLVAGPGKQHHLETFLSGLQTWTLELLGVVRKIGGVFGPEQQLISGVFASSG